MNWTPIILGCGLGVAQGLSAAMIEHTASDEIFPNPERGFYVQHTAVFADGRPAPATLNPVSLEAHYAQNISLILRFYVYEDSVAAPLTSAHLDLIGQDCAVLRDCGLKAVLRFAYTIDPDDPDAPLATVLGHLDQLAPVLQQNADVIATVQAGFIGTWGEWHSSSNGLGTTENMRTVLQHVLAAVPVQRAVGVRTPRYKQAIYDRTTPLSAAEAFSGSDISRTGHHNDCFLASDTDYGTYVSPAAEKVYLNRETQFVPMGGETCHPDPPRSLCPTAIAELEQMHWTYLNSTYHPDVLSGWTDGGCLDEIRRRLGYRLRLTRVAVPDAVRPGDPFRLELDLVNDGFAAPGNPRVVELVLRHVLSGATYDVTLPDDPRFWLPRTNPQQLVHHVLAPRDLPEGVYDLLVSLPDPEPAAYGRPRFAIRLANPGVWEAATGYNHLLLQLQVLGAAPAYTNGAVPILCPAPADAAPAPVAYAQAPIFAAAAPGHIAATSATVRARLVSDGGVNTEGWVYWGGTDGGTDPGAWDASRFLGAVSTGMVEAVLGGLDPETSYTYRFRAVSPAGAGWTPAATVCYDSDGDGMPDAWESVHFGGPTNAVAFADADGDGLLNIEEFICLTDPRDFGSRFVIRGVTGAAPVRIEYLSASGRVYALESRAGFGLSAPEWRDLGGNQAGSGALQQFADPALDAFQAYRVRVSLP